MTPADHARAIWLARNSHQTAATLAGINPGYGGPLLTDLHELISLLERTQPGIADPDLHKARNVAQALLAMCERNPADSALGSILPGVRNLCDALRGGDR